MDRILNNLLSGVQNYVILVLCLFIVVIIIYLIAIMRSLGKLEDRYRKFMRGTNNKNIEDLVVDYLDKVDRVREENESMKELCNKIHNEINGCVQKVSVVRYKAFEDVGSDLSFSIALLDYNNDGVILTGIYGRNDSTTYAKPIEKGISRYDLSQEEKDALEKAMSKTI